MTLESRIKRMDIFKIVPEAFKEASVFGIVFSVVFILLTSALLLNEFVNFISPRIESTMLVDHLKDDKDLTVVLDVLFPAYPCGLLSLDKLDVLHSHIVDVSENLEKHRVDSRQFVLGPQESLEGKDFNERIEIIKSQVTNREGCNLVGNFTVKMVPGNFHISFHNYGSEFQYLLRQGIYHPDMSHEVRKLMFGEADYHTQKRIIKDFGLNTLHTLNDSKHERLKEKFGFPHGVMNEIRIVPSRFEYSPAEVYEFYQYTTTSKALPTRNVAVYFQFDIENFYMHFKKLDSSFSHFCIQCMAILGGFYTLVMVLKLFFEEGVMKTVFKKRIGKLE